MNRILEKIEGLFIVNRKETTYTKGFFGLVLVLIIGFSLPIYFKYEDYTYAKYKEEYNQVVQIVEKYNSEHNSYPLGEPINWTKEKDLKLFFEENNFNINRELHYIDINLMSEIKNSKYTYIIDANQRNIYTSEFVVYKFNRWHYAFY